MEAYRGYAELEIARAFHTSLASFDQGMEFIVHNRLRMEVYQLFPSFLSEVAIVTGLALLIGTGSGDLGLVSGVFAVAAFRLIPAVRAVLNSWVQMFLIHFLQVVEIVRAFGIHTFVDDKVFTVFLMHQAVVAMRTSQDGVFGKTIIFGWRKKRLADLA